MMMVENNNDGNNNDNNNDKDNGKDNYKDNDYKWNLMVPNTVSGE